MKNAFRKLLLLALLPTLVVAHGAERIDPAVAQEASAAGMKTSAVLSLTSYDELLKNLDFIGELAGQPGSAQQAEMMINLFTQGQGLAGLDKSKPSGVIVQTDGMSVEVLAFIPVSDVKPLLGVLTAFDIVSEEGENGVFTVQAGPQELFVKSQGNWAFIARTVEALAAAPENPQQLLAGLDKEYDVALRLNVQNLPAKSVRKAIQGLQGGVAEGGGDCVLPVLDKRDPHVQVDTVPHADLVFADDVEVSLVLVKRNRVATEGIRLVPVCLPVSRHQRQRSGRGFQPEV